MEILILSPPVCTPAEPPSGAFILAASLAGHGKEVALLDLSLEFYHRVFRDSSIPGVRVGASIDYLLGRDGEYDPMKHRTASGTMHTKLKGFSSKFPGWRLTAMDLSLPLHVHDPVQIKHYLRSTRSPFEELWNESLVPVLEQYSPKTVVISLAYLSQLAAAIDLADFLKERGIVPVIGGSLPRSLATTGQGIDTLHNVFPSVDITNGASLVGGNICERDLLKKFSWPVLLSKEPYISARMVIPLTLSVGCFWRRCLFCPDRTMKFEPVPINAIDAFMETVPAEVMAKHPVIHLLDSSIPPGSLRRFLPIAKKHHLDFYGFARPTYRLLRSDLIEEAAAAGCIMLQLGVENGSGVLLDRYDKGINPSESAEVLRRAAVAGIRTYAYMLFGLPGETEADRESSLDLIERSSSYVDFLNLSLFNLPRYCELADRSEEFGVQINSYPGAAQSGADSIQLYTPFTCNGVDSRADARMFLQKRFLQVPAIRAINLRTPRWFRAAHLAMMKIPGRGIN